MLPLPLLHLPLLHLPLLHLPLLHLPRCAACLPLRLSLHLLL